MGHAGSIVSETNSRAIFDLSDISSRIPTIFEDNSSTGVDTNKFQSSLNNSVAWSEMSFQSDPSRFLEPTNPKKKNPGMSKILSKTGFSVCAKSGKR